MGFCCVFGCSNRTDRNKRKPGIAFHKFPRDDALKKRWINAIHRDKWVPNEHSRICNEHFSPEMVNNTYASGPKLRENAVPTIFPAYPKHLQTSLKVCKPPQIRLVNQASLFNEPEGVGMQVDGDVNSAAVLAEPSTKDASIQVEDNTTQTLISSLSNEVQSLKWRLKKAEAALLERRKKIKTIQKRNYRMKERISNMKPLMLILKKRRLIDDDNE